MKIRDMETEPANRKSASYSLSMFEQETGTLLDAIRDGQDRDTLSAIKTRADMFWKRYARVSP